jgi:hypothetical protein
MDEVRIKTEDAVRYVSRSRQLAPDGIDAYARETVPALREGRFVAAAGRELDGPPAERYPTDLDSAEPQMEIAFALLPERH